MRANDKIRKKKEGKMKKEIKEKMHMLKRNETTTTYINMLIHYFLICFLGQRQSSLGDLNLRIHWMHRRHILQYADNLTLEEWSISSKKSMSLNCIWSSISSFGDLGSEKYPLIAITPWSILTWRIMSAMEPFMGQIDLLKNYKHSLKRKRTL